MTKKEFKYLYKRVKEMEEELKDICFILYENEYDDKGELTDFVIEQLMELTDNLYNEF